MRITGARVRVLDTLDDTPLLPDLPEPGEHVGPRELVVLELETDDGLTGLGLTFWHGALAPALRAAVEALARAAIGADPVRTEDVAARLRHATGRTSADGSGIFHLALAAVDLACWDLKGKLAGQPVWSLLGGHRERVDGYASGALLRGYDAACLARSAERLVGLGFRSVKMQCGSEATADETVARVRAVRDAVGPDVEVMCDVNQLWSVHQAIELGRRLEPYRLAWLEDPVRAEDTVGLGRVTAALTTPVVAGEYAYGIGSFRRLIGAEAMDIVMVDVLRVGGITPWAKVAGMAQAHNLPVVSHRLPEIDVHLVPAVPNGLTVEYRPLTAGVFAEVPRLDSGQVVVPERPGLGLALDPGATDRYQVHEMVL